MTRKFTGRHIATILVAFFGIVIAVNFTMAWFAKSTFGGLVVQNSYVASQEFNVWLEKARQEEALGWSLDVQREPVGRLDVVLSSKDEPLVGAQIVATARHPVGRAADIPMSFRALGDGRYRSNETLPAGRWIVHVRAQSAGHEINRIITLI